MITFFKKTDSGLAVLDQPFAGCWINVIDPEPAEVAELQALHISSDYVTYPLDLDERARTERENGNLLIILRIPYFQGYEADIPYTTIPVGIILTDDYVVTVCKRETEVLRELSAGAIKGLSTAKKERFILYIFNRASEKYLSYLRKINKTVEGLEDKLQLSTRNKEVLELLKYQKSLTYFTTALKSNELMMERLRRNGMFTKWPEDQELLEDVLTENQQAIEMTNIASNILSSMMDAFASIISNNLNTVMKLLASITIIVSVPSVFAAFYGMNVDLPFDNHPAAFLLILGISLLTILIVIYVFWRRDWL